LRVLSAWETTFLFHEAILAPYLKTIEERTSKRVTFKMSGPDVVPTFEQFQPVQAGAFDILFTHAGYHAGTTAVGVAVDAIYADIAKRKDTGIWKYVDEHYQRLGLKLLAITPQGGQGFLFVMRKPVLQTQKPFEGMKIRGNVTYHGLIKTLGGAPVLLAGGEVYSGLEKGVIDGAAWSIAGPIAYKWNEVAKFYTTPVFGQSDLMLFMNLTTWQTLSAEDRKIIEDASSELEVQTQKKFDELNAQEFKDMEARGMKATAFPPAVASQLDKLMADGIWGLALEKSPAEGKKFREFVESKKMTP
jgi:TRAP-type C4-dicarboxylate transport system substrate-binding protein